MVVGGGGREHALAWRLAQDPDVAHVWIAPGNAGTDGDKLTKLAAGNITQWVDAAKRHKINLTVVGPEEPLAAGIADAFAHEGLTLLGPQADAARLESSKSYAKDLMTTLGISTAPYVVADDLTKVNQWLSATNPPYVLKADGLARGKGVEIKHSVAEAQKAAALMLAGKYGASSKRIVLEQFISGSEISLTALCAGRIAVPLLCCTDYKRLFTDDQGPNTGGMGACCPSPVLKSHGLDISTLLAQFIHPILEMLADTGISYHGFIYAGLIVQQNGSVQALEYNVRLGDPEAQVLMSLWKGSVAQCLHAAANGTLEDKKLKWADLASVSVVLAAPGYPELPQLGIPLELPSCQTGDMLFHCATRQTNCGKLISNGGRVVCVTSWRKNLTAARDAAYSLATKVSLPGAQFRTDIAALA